MKLFPEIIFCILYVVVESVGPVNILNGIKIMSRGSLLDASISIL